MNWSDDETDNPLLADEHNYYKVEKWTKDAARSTECSTPAITSRRPASYLLPRSSTGLGSG
jgi:hypothetical protein